ncbi:Diacylglycerol kinase [Balamuthia mandrillaris]
MLLEFRVTTSVLVGSLGIGALFSFVLLLFLVVVVFPVAPSSFLLFLLSPFAPTFSGSSVFSPFKSRREKQQPQQQKEDSTELIMRQSNNGEGMLPLHEEKEKEYGGVVALTTTAASHRFLKKHFSRPTFCNYCRSFVWGFGRQAYSCTICKYAIHKRCLKGLNKKAPPTCQPTTIPSLFFSTLPTSFNISHHNDKEKENDDQDEKLLESFELFKKHHWLEANIKAGSQCAVCVAPIPTFGLQGFRCSRCFQTVHTNCMKNMKDEHCLPRHWRLLWLGAPSSLDTTNIHAHQPHNSVEQETSTTEITNYFQPENTPLIAFINSKGRGAEVEELKRRLERWLGPNQIFELTEQQPTAVLDKFRFVPNLRVLACGGDGTMAWVLQSIHKARLPITPALCPLPLGTGNDLARTLGWGGGYDGESLSPILRQIEAAEVVRLDQWKVKVSPEVKNNNEEHHSFIMNNYFSIGVDARIAMKFHELREEMPSLCSTRLANKFFYANYGLHAMVEDVIADIPPVDKVLTLQVDGKLVPLPQDLGGICIINLPSYMGGCNLWGTSLSDEEGESNDGEISQESREETKKWREQRIDDGLLEVVGLANTFHMATIQVNLANAVRIAQGTTVRVEYFDDRETCMQVDGEPHRLRKGVVEVAYKRTTFCLKKKEKEEDEKEEPTFEGRSLLATMMPAMLPEGRFEALKTQCSDLQEVFYSLFE